MILDFEQCLDKNLSMISDYYESLRDKKAENNKYIIDDTLEFISKTMIHLKKYETSEKKFIKNLEKTKDKFLRLHNKKSLLMINFSGYSYKFISEANIKETNKIQSSNQENKLTKKKVAEFEILVDDLINILTWRRTAKFTYMPDTVGHLISYLNILQKKIELMSKRYV